MKLQEKQKKVVFFKNIVLHVVLLPFYVFAVKELSMIPKEKLDTMLLFVGLIVIAPITSNFIFSYKNAVTDGSMFWGHLTTFFSMLVIGMLFISLDILLVIMIGNVFIFRSALLLFWVAVVTFDFADFHTIENCDHQ